MSEKKYTGITCPKCEAVLEAFELIMDDHPVELEFGVEGDGVLTKRVFITYVKEPWIACQRCGEATMLSHFTTMPMEFRWTM